MKKIKLFTLTSIFGLTLTMLFTGVFIAVSPSTVVHSEEFGPVFSSNAPDPSGYGGLDGSLGDTLVDGDTGVFRIEVTFPVSMNVQDYGELQMIQSTSFEDLFTIDDSPTCSELTDTDVVCEYFAPLARFGQCVFKDGRNEFRVEYIDENGEKKFVRHETSAGDLVDAIDFQMKCPMLNPGGGILVNNGNVVISDFSVKQHELTALVRSDAQIEGVEFSVGAEKFLEAQFEEVSDVRFADGKARKYSYTLDVSAAEQGSQYVNAAVVGSNGQENGLDGWYKLDIAISVDQRLLQQCKDASGAIAILFADINEVAASRQQRFEQLYLTVQERAFLSESADIESTAAELERMYSAYRSSVGVLEVLQEAECVTTMSDLIQEYREAYIDYRESLRVAANELKSLINQLIDQQEGGNDES